MSYSSLIYPASVISLLILFFFLSLKWENLFKKPLILICWLMSMIYLIWRAFFTLPSIGSISFAAGMVLWITEFIGFLQLCVFYILVWKPARKKEVPLKCLEKLPMVDVLIVTYNEPLDVLRRTIAGCLNLDYPKERLNIYICDDGSRETVEKLAWQFHVHYLKREDHSFAKAGNLNHALQHTSGEFIVTLDADMVPLAPFLQRTIGLFSDPEVAFVQTPQAFYNDDPYQFNTFSTDHLPNEQDFFMRTLQAGKARFNAVMFVGSNAVFRRSALEAIGGFATGVITEDMATGMILQAKKFRTLFVGDVLAMGLAPESWGDMLKQRDRWCRGNIQCARKWNPLTLSGLSFMQRLLYIDGIVYWFFGIFKLVYILAPLIYMLFGVYFLKTDLYSLACFWLPSFLGSYLTFRLVSRGQRSMTWSHIYDTSMAPSLAFSALSELFFRKKLNFKVTPKGQNSEKRHFHLSTVMPHLFCLIMTAVAFTKIGIDYFFFHNLRVNEVSFNLFWAFYNMIGLALSLTVAVNRPRFRRGERFRVNRPGRIEFTDEQRNASLPVTIVDMSDSGARLSFASDHFHEYEQFAIRSLAIDPIGTLPCRLVWLSHKSQDGDESVGIQFEELSDRQYSRVIHYLFNIVQSQRPFLEDKTGSVRTLARFLRKSFKVPQALKRQNLRRSVHLDGYIFRIPETKISRAAMEAAVAFSDDGPRRPFTIDPEQKPVVIKDISVSGCQILTTFALKLNETIVLNAKPDLGPVKAEVRWQKKKFGHYFIGIKFLS